MLTIDAESTSDGDEALAAESRRSSGSSDYGLEVIASRDEPFVPGMTPRQSNQDLRAQAERDRNRDATKDEDDGKNKDDDKKS